jgi:hypothetical protein
MWREILSSYINVLLRIAGQLEYWSSVSGTNSRIFLYHHPQLPVQWLLRAQGLLSFYLEFLVLDIQAVINMQFSALVFCTFPEKECNFESRPTRKNEEADRCLEDIWSRKAERSVMLCHIWFLFIHVSNSINTPVQAVPTQLLSMLSVTISQI